VTQQLEALLARLDQERQDADRRYNDALTALDAAVPRMPEMPHPPPAYDPAKLADVNSAWDLLPDGAPPIDGSLKGRLRGFIWRLVGPPLDTQKRFNAALVDHLNRNVAAHVEAARASVSTIEILRQHIEGLQHFQARLIQYLQTVTLYVDTKDRAVGGQAHVVNAGLGAITDDWLKRWESQAAREARRSALVEDLRATAALAQQTVLSLKREIERALALTPARPGAEASDRPAGQAPVAPGALDAYKYLGFEDAFRGSSDDIRERLASYVPSFADSPGVLDLGCGRGEFLELLREAGIAARGLDLNHEMVEACRARGLDVVEGDALGFVESLPDASLGGIFAAQMVEHLEPGYLMRLLEAAFHKLRPGGTIVLETINVACWAAFFDSYVRDLTHVRPLHPDTLQYLLRASGFRDVRIELRSPVPEPQKLQRLTTPDLSPGVAEAMATLNENIDKLNARLFTSLDYAAVGRR
jgi:SAM-dependent methyltransferase